MVTLSEISPATVLAYRESDYCVFGEFPFVLRVGAYSDSLASVYRKCGVDCAGFVTACNPFSKVLSTAANGARQAQLKEVLGRHGLDYVVGSGQHPSGDWMAEPSCFIPGVSLEDTKALGRKFDQNAVVWCGADAIPQLVLLR